VLVEKPLAPDAAAAAELARRVESAGALLMVAQTLRFDPVVEALLRERDGIGELCLISLNQRFEPSARSWIDTPGCGGLLLNTGVHGFDLLRHLSGLEPLSVWAETARIETRRTEDQFVATLRLGDGRVQAVLDNARSSRSRSGRIELVGRAGQLWGDHIHRTLVRVTEGERRELGPVPRRPTLPATLEAFVGAVLSGTPPPVTVHDGRAAVRMVEAAARSAAEQRRVSMSEIP
jgi:predicted dehydrogenase